MNTDTIFALSTPPGKSGIAVIRLSGKASLQVWQSLCRSEAEPTARLAHSRVIYQADGQIIDKPLLIFFKAPKSFTGEDMLEIHLHGGHAIIQSAIKALSAIHGVRSAEPGEFMRRAFFAGKVDLLEAEAVADMIDAETAAQLSQANKQMSGEFSAYYKQLRANIIEILALFEAYIDFPEEEIPPTILLNIEEKIRAYKQQIARILDDKKVGEKIRSGIKIGIIGAPNVGKSTLLNQLAGRDVAITSEHAGTTRDVIDVSMDIGGYAAHVFDTAGIRESSDEVEKIGIERSWRVCAEADILLFMADADALDISLHAINEMIKGHKHLPPALLIINKLDKVQLSTINALVKYYLTQQPSLSSSLIYISAKTGDGMDKLIDALIVELKKLLPTEHSLITRDRHRNLLGQAHHFLPDEIMGKPLELLCEDIRLASNAIAKMTGEIQIDELLDVIFSRFCIGK